MAELRHLSIDIETFSSVDLVASGLYKYVEADDFEILLIAYAFDFGDVQIIDLAQGELPPAEFLEALNNPKVIKHAYNAQFEITCLSKFYKTNANQWQCTKVHASYLNRGGSLKNVGINLKLDNKDKKDQAGTLLINYFSKPCKPTKSNGNRLRNLPRHDLNKWELFKSYCKQDVVAEMQIYKRLKDFKVPPSEWVYWQIDQVINKTGVKVDSSLINSVLDIANTKAIRNLSELKELTGLNNPNSVLQLKKFVEDKYKPIDSLDKEAVNELLADEEAPDKVKRVLKIRQELAKSSLKKFNSMLEAKTEDDRIKGLFNFYGASTGRWAGKLVQVQNLPRNYIEGEELKEIRQLAINKDVYAIQEKSKYSLEDTLSQLIRTAFIPEKDKLFIVADYSAIEARVIAWLANEKWRNDVFRGDGKIYEKSAAMMFNVPIETIAHGQPNYHLRAKGKVAELACGYGGGVNALKAFGADKLGLTDDELADIIRQWRANSPNIVRLWQDVKDAAQLALVGQPSLVNGLTFSVVANNKDSYLKIELPTGRALFYPEPKLITSNYHEELSYLETEKGQPIRVRTYGGKLVENIVQALARDCLAITLLRLHIRGFEIVMHVHDEIICEVEKEQADEKLKEMLEVMRQPIKSLNGLYLKGEGFKSEYYMKG